MDKRFPPPSDNVLHAVCLLMHAVCESAKLAEKNGDHADVRATSTQYRYLDRVFEAILERRRGATVH